MPVICITNPDHVDAGPNPPQTQLLKYFGYDFLEFSKNNSFNATLEYGSGQIVKQNFGFVNILQNYELTLNIQGETQTLASLDRNKGPAVVLRWGGKKVSTDSGQSAIPVLIPTPTPTPTPIPTKLVTLSFEADQWGGAFSCWDQRHDYTKDITIDQGWHWDGDVNSVKNSLTYTKSNWGGRGTPSVYLQQDPVLDNDNHNVKVIIHVGAGSDCTAPSPHLYITINAREVKN